MSRQRARCPIHGRAQSNVQRNICLIWCEPPPVPLAERIRRTAWRLEQFWARHVTDREACRRLDRLRLLAPEHPWSPEEGLGRARRNTSARAEGLPSEPPAD